jgi:phosphatidylserine decarboxylase
VLLFEKGMVSWDEDLTINSRAALETLVRVGMGIGHRRHLGTAQRNSPLPPSRSPSSSA